MIKQVHMKYCSKHRLAINAL